MRKCTIAPGIPVPYITRRAHDGEMAGELVTAWRDTEGNLRIVFFRSRRELNLGKHDYLGGIEDKEKAEDFEIPKIPPEYLLTY